MRLESFTLICAAACAAATMGPAAVTDGGAALAADRRYVCAETLWLRDDKAGKPIGILYNGEAFDLERSDGVWSYGYAYGGENKRGWVLHSGLSGADGTCR